MNSSLSNKVQALGDPTRRTIFERLGRGPMPVGEIAAGLPVTRPAVSQHLKVLKDAGLVIDHKAGSHRIYQISPDGIAGLREYFAQFWGDAFSALQQEVTRTDSIP